MSEPKLRSGLYPQRGVDTCVDPYTFLYMLSPNEVHGLHGSAPIAKMLCGTSGYKHPFAGIGLKISTLKSASKPIQAFGTVMITLLYLHHWLTDHPGGHVQALGVGNFLPQLNTQCFQEVGNRHMHPEAPVPQLLQGIRQRHLLQWVQRQHAIHQLFELG